MRRTREVIQAELEQTRKRLDRYLAREDDMLDKNGVQSYGIGSRNLQHYNTALKDVQDMIEKLRARIRSWRQSWRAAARGERWASSPATGNG